MNIEISDKAVQFIRDLVAEIDRQDNRCTAKPYFYTIQEEIERTVRDGHGDLTRYFDWDNVESYEPEELIERDRQEYDDDLDDGERLARQVDDRSVEKYEVTKEWEDTASHNVFFTERGAKRHLEINGHNFRRPTRTYVKHAFRNCEMDGLFDALREIAGPLVTQVKTRAEAEEWLEGQPDPGTTLLATRSTKIDGG